MASNVIGQEVSLQELRAKIDLASKDKATSKNLYNRLEAMDLKGKPVLGAYAATLETMQAKYSINPYTKLKYFNQGKKDLESIIAQYPNNLEIRLLRLSIQINVPRLLNYSDDIVEDKKLLLNNLNQIVDEELKKNIKGFLLMNDVCTEEEKRLINEI